MKTLLSLCFVAAILFSSHAAQVTAWSDTFTGGNGTVVAPGTNWQYTNAGVETNGFVTVPRTDAQDLTIITNNMLFSYVGPVTNLPSEYNKVQKVITPLSSGTPVSIDVQNGTVAVQLDLVNMEHNGGHRWNLGQEFKLSLSPQPVYVDPNDVSNTYIINMGIRPLVGAGATSSYISLIHVYTTNGPLIRQTLYSMPNLPPPFQPKTVRFEYSAGDFIVFYTNGVQLFSSNSPITAAVLPTPYVQIWHGMFNGEGSVSSTGSVIVDNVAFSYAPPIGWCNLQWPQTLSAATTNGAVYTDKVYGQIWIDGITSLAGPTSGLYAWVGFGPTNASPAGAAWVWTPADFNVQVGNNDEFHTNIFISGDVPAGTYGYAYRYKYLAGPYTYGQLDGPHTEAAFSPAQCGLLTVVPEPTGLVFALAGCMAALRLRGKR